MKIGIIALCLSLVALGFGVFATVDSLGDDDARTVPATSNSVPGWSDAECVAARKSLFGLQWHSSSGESSTCDPDSGLACAQLQVAINENCP